MKTLRPLYRGLFYIILVIAQVVFRLCFIIQAEGREHIERGKGYVLAPNHLFAIDPAFVILARGFRKKMLIMGKEELFEKSALLNFFWDVCGAFPVERGAGSHETIREAAAAVQNGYGLLIFPEGTRSKDGRLGRLKSGALVVAAATGADIVPCHIRYKAGRPRAFSRVIVTFGAPLSAAEMGLAGEHGAKELRHAKALLAARINALGGTEDKEAASDAP